MLTLGALVRFFNVHNFRYPVYPLELASLFADAGSRSPEEACVQLFKEAVRRAPSIVYAPDLPRLWDSTGVAMHHLLYSLITGTNNSSTAVLVYSNACVIVSPIQFACGLEMMALRRYCHRRVRDHCTVMR